MKLSNFKRPTIYQLKERINTEITTRLKGTDPLLKNSVLSILSSVTASTANDLYAYISYLALQIFPDTAEQEYLNRWGAIWGVCRKNASFAKGTVVVKGLEGALLPAGTRFNARNKILYISESSVIIPKSGEIDVVIKAEKSGTLGNIEADTELSLMSPIKGIDSKALVSQNGLTGGSEIENEEDYRNRILKRIQEPPRGGSKSDYENWAMEVPGVTRAWCTPLEDGLGTVGVRFMMDYNSNKGIPNSEDKARVQKYIDSPIRKPVGAKAIVYQLKAAPIDIVIRELKPESPQVKQDIKNELERLFKKYYSPSDSVYISKIWETISSVKGVRSFELLSPSKNVEPKKNYIPVIGEVKFINEEV